MLRLGVSHPLRCLRVSSLPLSPLLGASFVRFQHTPSKPPTPPPVTPVTQRLIQKTIPGETVQSNSLRSRMPSFPLSNKTTLLPRPGVPTGGSLPLRSMLEVLNKKTAPELIYEAESHKVYFLICGALAVIFTVYGLTFVDWGFRAVFTLYEEDEDLMMLATRFGMCVAITAIALCVLTMALKFPTRLVRRIWLVPAEGGEKWVRFTTHPMLPGRATPVYNVPLTQLVRSHKSKIFTRNGHYGTLDKSTFFFLLKETDKKFGYWIVDRNGWFWGDGRVFDVLFGKETLEEAAKCQGYNEKLKQVNDKLLEERNKLKEEHGTMWQLKAQHKLMKGDLKKVVGVVGKRLPK